MRLAESPDTRHVRRPTNDPSEPPPSSAFQLPSSEAPSPPAISPGSGRLQRWKPMRRPKATSRQSKPPPFRLAHTDAPHCINRHAAPPLQELLNEHDPHHRQFVRLRT